MTAVTYFVVFVLGDSMSSVRSDTFVVVPSVSRLTPEQKKESLFEAAKTGKKTFILKYFYSCCYCY